MKYWLMKSEPETYSIDDLKRNKVDHWDGVRNYQARNFMRDEMKKGDKVLFYHSNCAIPGVVGTAEVWREGYPDHTAFDKKSRYFDPKSSPDNPRWIMVDIKFKQKFALPVSLEAMKNREELAGMKVVQKGNRLSITPVSPQEFEHILKLASVRN